MMENKSINGSESVESVEAPAPKKEWYKPVLSKLDISLTLSGGIAGPEANHFAKAS
jgi:hypothetical protein